ncbi:Asp-tRNA(Asn)/Glu-tRNA(Gln) amidotransferase subunit GatC [Clostridium sp. MSJ-11]|uniref:Aspartyl/glutamyl-tRNA(Asn/Gln) amidotransferase subunit C n=1 Tax=Clostridium mobile TaxID=2841512 RepID=A0ABS6EJQ3_9CLOT|nr:Asp-tRNA(Asn)/Glu-tRNA(Gln) amidotransferase subunit GatC [Clostridium mobile]MBU5485367.1 Asp-tRNA(Asn)/Glu-tRNA(Gln) amidotransferase subunit GatC [Clostridium mobile]
MSITKKDVEHVSELARVELKEEEKEALIEDLNKVLAYMEKLDELDTDDVDIIVNPYYAENVFREDKTEPSMKIEEVLSNAPEKLEGYVLVPQILDGE